VSDVIEIAGLHLMGRHGVLDFEKETPQPFDIDLKLQVDLARAAADDDLSQTVSYVDLINVVRPIVEEQHFALIEGLAGAIVSAVLEFALVEAAEVTVRKPHAAVGAAIDYAAVTLRRP
jgi:dihydroneopterin aldolase